MAAAQRKCRPQTFALMQLIDSTACGSGPSMIPGLVAVVDTRLLKPAGSEFTCVTSSRTCRAALKRFNRKMSLGDAAVAFLSEPQSAAG